MSAGGTGVQQSRLAARRQQQAEQHSSCPHTASQHPADLELRIELRVGVDARAVARRKRARRTVQKLVHIEQLERLLVDRHKHQAQALREKGP